MTKRRLKSHFPSGVNNSLGKSLLNQARTKSSFNEKQSTLDAGKFDSRTQESSVQEILTNYKLANKNFEAERSDLKIIGSKGDTTLLEGLEEQNLDELHVKYGHLLSIPRRPKPDTYQTAEELDSLETSQFLDWRRKLAKLSEASKIVITPFERNLEVWRQLWRVVERSDVVVQIVDARNPSLFRSIDLEHFVKEVDPSKKNLLLINKADLLSSDQIICWKKYFEEKGIFAIFWSNKQTVDKNVENVNESEYRSKDSESNEVSDEGDEEDDEENIEEFEDDEEEKLNESIKKCETSVTELSSQIECSDNYFVESPSDLLQIFETFATTTPKDNGIVIGMVGYPNVGKSSTINRLIGTKKIAVSSTPGKTKHFQTLVANERITLCDCPGLVMPSFGLSNSEMILNGILPIAHMQDYYSPISLLCSRIPRHVLQRHYSILLPKKEPVQAHDFLTAVAFLKGYMSSSGIPDCSRSARLILRDVVQGEIRWCIAPPGISQEQFDNWTYKNFIKNTENSNGKEVGKNLLEQMQRRDLLLDTCGNEEFNKTLTKTNQVETRIEKEFFPRMEDIKRGIVTMRLKNSTGESLIEEEKRSKKHFNKNKRQKLRRIFVATSLMYYLFSYDVLIMLTRLILFQLPRDLLSFGAVGCAMFTRKLQSNKKIPSGLTPLEDVSQLSPLVLRILGQNPGAFTLQGTNTYLVGKGAKKILIDAGEPNVSQYLNNLIDSLSKSSSTIEAIVVTHWHADHTGGIGQILRYLKKDIPIYKLRRTDGQPESNEFNFTFVEDGHELQVEGTTLRFLSTPGHTSDHTVLWLEEEGTLFSGDCVLGEGSAIFENLDDYMKSLRKLLDLAPKQIYPGHGPVVEDPKQKILEYIENRNRREQEILSVILNDGPATTMQITNSIYTNILPSRRLGALLNVRHHLVKLMAEGKIEDIGPSVGGLGFGLYVIADEKKRDKNKL